MHNDQLKPNLTANDFEYILGSITTYDFLLMFYGNYIPIL